MGYPAPTNPPPGPYAAILETASPADAAAINAINPPKRKPGRPRKEKDTIPVPGMAEEAVAPQFGPGVITAHITQAVVAQDAQQPVRRDTYDPANPPPAPAPAAAAPLAAAPAPGPDARPIIDTLMVGCHVWSPKVPVAVIRFETFVAKAQEMIGEGAYWAGYGYKTNGVMLQAMQRLITEARPETLVIEDARCPEAVLALSWLRANALYVIEGGR